jgi:hypothetical protein
MRWARALLSCCGMSTKSKRRGARRAQPTDSTTGATSTQPKATEKRVAGAIMSGLLNAITFGVLDDSPQSQKQPPSQRTPQPA